MKLSEAYEQEHATPLYFCHGVFTDRFIFKSNLLWMRLPWECHNQSQDTNWRHCVTGPELPFFHKRKGVLKIDQSVKMPWYRLSIGVASSCSSAPELSCSTAITTGCSPTCGANAFCGESSGRPVCTCNPGYQGDGYNCTGWCQWCRNELSSFSSSPSKHQHRICSNTCPNLQILKATKKALSSAFSVNRRQW